MNILDLVGQLSHITGFDEYSIQHFFQSSNEQSTTLEELRDAERKLLVTEYGMPFDIEIILRQIIDDYFLLNFAEILVRIKMISQKVDDEDIKLIKLILNLIITGKEQKFPDIDLIEKSII